jgi:hypothetical protein
VPTIETLLLANHAEQVNGLLYVSGGGWTDHWRSPTEDGESPISHIGIALTVLLGWNETNTPHPLLLTVENDRGEELVRIEGEMEAGLPEALPPGGSIRNAIAINVDVTFPIAGEHVVRAVAGDEMRSVSFSVHDADPGGGDDVDPGSGPDGSIA